MFLACKHHYTAKGRMARKDVKEESDYHDKGGKSIMLLGSVESSKGFLLEKDSTIKNTFIWHNATFTNRV